MQAALDDLPGGSGMSRRIDSAVTLLPEPDSPTMPSVSLAVEREAHAVDRLDHAVVGEEVGRETFDREQPFAHTYSLSLGSVASRRPLPNEMKANTVTVSAMLGNVTIHQLPACRYVR